MFAGPKVTLDGKEEHFRKFHLEYSFHHVKGVASSHIHCDICGKAVGSYKSLVKSHNHNMAHESDLTCDICGTKVPMDGKGDHFKKIPSRILFPPHKW